MGNQPSKEGGKGGSSSSGLGPKLESLPSFSKSDTQGSTRSFRQSIKNKIPGSASKSDGDRYSTSAISSPTSDRDVHEKSDVASLKSSFSQRRRQSDVASSPESMTRRESMHSQPEVRPPPSPTMSATLGHGHSAVQNAQKRGEVEHVSDAPPTGNIQHSSVTEPRESILTRRDNAPPPPPKSDNVSSPTQNLTVGMDTMNIGSLANTDLDDYIKRLIDAAYNNKQTKTVCLKNAEITAICQAAREVFLAQPALLELAAPVKIVGDVHGQYMDLIRMFEMCGFPPNSNYLFLGDYVDRGKQSLETILLLLCYKLRFPENFFLLRGNHESANVTRVYGFYDECKRRCNVKIWKTFVDTFNCLPIAAIVAGKIFCVHGGLSPSLVHMDDIRHIARPTDVPDYGLLNDLLWSDPADMESDWEANERGVSYCFGKKVIMEFLAKHDFDLVCRAHMVVEDGYEFFTDRVLVTVFSAPNVGYISVYFVMKRALLTFE